MSLNFQTSCVLWKCYNFTKKISINLKPGPLMSEIYELKISLVPKISENIFQTVETEICYYFKKIFFIFALSHLNKV